MIDDAYNKFSEGQYTDIDDAIDIGYQQGRADGISQFAVEAIKIYYEGEGEIDECEINRIERMLLKEQKNESRN